MSTRLKNIVKRYTPGFIMSLYHHIMSYRQSLIEAFYISQIQYRQRKALARIGKKETIRCVFFATLGSSWQYDSVYKALEKHPRFDPVVLICPVVDFGIDNMIARMEECERLLNSKGFKVVKAYDVCSHQYINVRKELRPDLIFYTSPYKTLVGSKFYITNFMDILGVYVPYFINGSPLVSFSSDLLLHNLVWRKYAEYENDKEIAIRYQRVHGRNVVLTGYPDIEKLIDESYKPSSSEWKIQDRRVKRIIWAPHHTLEKSPYGHTCFLLYCDFMIEMAQKYQHDIQIAFKPHPLLRNKLELVWGKDRTDHYYSKWATMPNTILQEGDYVDLFLTSDAMIHDSGSFVFEYLFVNKPVMRTVYDVPLESQFNSLALSCLDQYYKCQTQEGIEQFIQNVINNVDPLKEQRTKFVKDILMPKGSPSQNILNDLLDSINNQILYRN